MAESSRTSQAMNSGPRELRVYLAARYSRREELCDYRLMLQEAGFVVTSRWLDGPDQLGPDGYPIGDEGEDLVENGGEASHFADVDLSDVEAAEWFVTFTEQPGTTTPGRVGRHIEFGYALAKGLSPIIVGPRENIFHWTPTVMQFDWWDQAFAYLCGVETEGLRV